MYLQLKNQLEEKLDEIVGKIQSSTNSPVVFGHICWGNLSSPGSLRLTRIAVNPDINISKQLHGFPNNEITFTHHINKVGRKNTLLDFLSIYFFNKKLFKKDEIIKSNFICKIVESNEPLQLDFDTFLISTNFVEKLFPIDSLKAYLLLLKNEFLENNISNNSKENTIEQIRSFRYRAYEYLIENNFNNSIQLLNDLSKFYIKYEEEENYLYLNFLGELQTGLMYVLAICDSIILGSGFIAKGQAIIKTETEIFDNPMIMFSSVFCQESQLINVMKSIDNNIESIYPKINSVCEKIDKPITRVLENSISNIKERFHAYHIESLIEQNVKDLLNPKVLPRWTTQLILWNAILIEKLRNSIHEGESLNFFFVVADISEIKDSGLFDMIKLDFSDYPANIAFHPWDNSGQELIKDEKGLDELIIAVKREIEKKNYSWFLDAKYALLWDSTFPEKFPHSLIRINNSNWNIIISELRNRRAEDFFNKINLSLIFLKEDQSGGIIVKNKLISSFRKGSSWSKGNIQKEKDVYYEIKAAINKWPPQFDNLKVDIIEEITKIILTISDDPNSGCMAIFSCKDLEFDDMGKPWKTKPYSIKSRNSKRIFNYSTDEITALMGMDGATCIFLDDAAPHISFRNIVMVGKSKRFKGIKDPDILSGEGSRKWSAFNVAKLYNVDLVIAVSQDGPIYIYKHNNSHEVTIIKIE